MPVREVRVRTSLSNDGFKKGIAEMENEVKKLKHSLTKLSDANYVLERMGDATKKSQGQFESMNKTIDQTKAKISELAQEQDRLGEMLEKRRNEIKSGLDTSYAKSIAENKRSVALNNGASESEAQKAYANTYYAMMTNALDKALAGDSAFQKMVKTADDLNAKYAQQNQLLREQSAERDRIGAKIEAEKAAVKKQIEEERNVAKALLRQKEKKLNLLRLNAFASKMKTGLAGLVGLGRNVPKSVESGRMFKGLIRGAKMLGLAVLGVRTAWSLVRKSMSYVLDEHKELANSIKGMSVGMGAAFAPAVEAALKSLVKVFNIFAAIYKMLTGINIVSKANAKLAKDAAASRSAAKFDEVNVLQQSGGGGGGNTENLLKEVVLSEKLKAVVNEVKETWEGLSNAISRAWNSAGAGEVIIGALSTAANMLYEWFININNITQEWLANLDLAPLFRAIGGWMESLNPLLQDVLNALTWIYENIVLPLLKYIIEDAGPRILELFSSINNLIDTLWHSVLEPLWDFLWETFIKPLADFLGEKILDGLDDLKEGIDGMTKFIEKHGEAIQTVLIIIGSVIAALTIVLGVLNTVHSVSMLLNNVISGMAAAFSCLTSPIGLVVLAIGAVIAIIVLCIKHWDAIKEAAANAADWIGQKWEGLKNALGKYIDGVKERFNRLLSWIKGTFSEGWCFAWDGIKNIFKGAWNGIAGIVENVLNGIIRGMNKISFKLPDWAGGWSFGFNLQPVSIPRLAKGAVIPPNREFMAVLGDQKNGRNIEAPEDLIRQIVAEETDRQNGEIIRLLRIIAAKNLTISKRQIGGAAVDYINDETDRRGGISPIVAI